MLLKEDEGLFYALTEHSPEAIFIAVEGRFAYANAATLRLFGARSAAELLGQPVMARIHPDDHEVVAARIARLREHGEPAGLLEETYLRLDGSPVAVEVTAAPFRYGGREAGVVFVRDITERKRAEAQIRALNDELGRSVAARTAELAAKAAQLDGALALNENILMASAAGLLVYRQDGQCVLANPAAAELVGGTREQMMRQNFRRIPSWPGAGLLEAAERALATGERVSLKSHFVSSFGRDAWVEAEFCPFTSRGKPHLLLVLHDITARQHAAEALAEREREFRALAENVPDNIIRYGLDGRILFLNRTVERTLGCRAEDVVGRTVREVWPDGRFDAFLAVVRRVGATGVAADFEQIVPGPDGEPRYHLIRIVPELDPDGRPASVLAVGRDLTEQRLVAEELRLAASVYHSSAEGVVVTDGEGRIVSVNPAFTAITGYAAAEVLGRNPSLLHSGRQGPDFYRHMWDTLLSVGRWQGEVWNRRKSGEEYLEWLTVSRIDDEAGAPVRYVGVFSDITELRRKDEHIQHLAFHDALTGLPNRTLMLERLQQALFRARRENWRLAVAFIDLDHFKSVNDALGHDVGDLLLQEVARRVGGRLRASDTVARLGGDEFVVLMDDIKELGHAAALTQALIGQIARPMELRGHSVEIGASVGLAFFPEDGHDALELMKRADVAMYAAKAAGRNTYRFFQHEMLERTSQRLTLEMELRRAVGQGQLELHYQPRVALASGAPNGVEALVRWRHPKDGLRSPGDFIPLAEENGLVVDIGNWVLDEACRQCAAWRAAGRAVRVAVNVSARQLDAGDLVERIAALTARHGISPADLEIELTETTVMANPEKVAGLFARLRELGVTVAVDDFGTGYSSLAYLRRLPIDVLKIDRSFVMDADRDEEDAQIVKTILALGQALKLKVVAEGIETPRQATLLQLLGCDMGQGYLFSKPLPADELAAWLDGAQRPAPAAGPGA